MSAIATKPEEATLADFSGLVPGVLFRQRPDGSISCITGQVEAFTGLSMTEWPQQPANRFWEVVHSDDTNRLQEQLKRAAQSNEVTSCRFRIRHLTTKSITCVQEHRASCRDAGGGLTGFNVVWLDVTQPTIAEKLYKDTNWTETTVKLTNVLIHDFNNLMTGIHAISESFRSQIDANHAFHEGLEFVQRNAIHAKDLVMRMAALNQTKSGSQKFHNINDLITEELDLIRKIIPRTIRIETALAPDSLPVYVDAADLRRVIAELILNATRAMPQGGKLRLETSRFTETPTSGYVRGTMPSAPRIVLAVSDSGSGIPMAQVTEMFEPLSSAGMPDLARVFQLAERHRGAISVDSTVGNGMVIRVWLPEADFTRPEVTHS